MKRLVLVIAAIGIAVLLIGGVALAATLEGTGGDDTLIGDKGFDTCLNGELKKLALLG